MARIKGISPTATAEGSLYADQNIKLNGGQTASLIVAGIESKANSINNEKNRQTVPLISQLIKDGSKGKKNSPNFKYGDSMTPRS